MASSAAQKIIAVSPEDASDPRLYECAVLYPYPLSQKEEQEVLKEVEGYFAEAGAKLILKDSWGRRGLAYAIKGATEASIVIYYYEIDPLKIKELDQQLRIQKTVLRHLFVKPPKDYQIQKWGEMYEKWLKERESIGQVRAREREEKLQEQVAKRARKQVELAATRKKEEAPAVRMEEDVLTEKIEKLISDDTLDL